MTHVEVDIFVLTLAIVREKSGGRLPYRPCIYRYVSDPSTFMYFILSHADSFFALIKKLKIYNRIITYMQSFLASRELSWGFVSVICQNDALHEITRMAIYTVYHNIIWLNVIIAS